MTFDVIKSAVEEAGFFTSYDTDFGRLICASMSGPEGLSGNSFWIVRRGEHWFLGTWGSHLYRISDAQRVPELCTTWLQRQPRATASDVDDHIRGEFHLVEIEDLPHE
jgi:hypothetical protein